MSELYMLQWQRQRDHQEALRLLDLSLRNKAMVTQTAKQIHDAIKANVAAFYDDQIDFAELHKRNSALWSEARPVAHEVLKLWREECLPIGNAR